MIAKLLTLALCAVAAQCGGGAGDGYIFDDQAEGWLKLYPVPATWIDARIRCETEGSVLASPLAEKLRDSILRLVQTDRRASSIFTGVQADYSNGEFLSIEGVPLQSLPVNLRESAPLNYGSPESCIAWDVVGFTDFRKVKCDSKFPYVCYKKRKLEPLPGSSLGGRDPEKEESTVPPQNKPEGTGVNQNTQRPTSTLAAQPQTEFGNSASQSQSAPVSSQTRPTNPDQRWTGVTASPSQTMPGSYKYVRGANGRLKLHAEDTWRAAANRCAAEGATLASPLTTELREAINGYVLQTSGEANMRLFTGVQANFTSGDYVSIDGVALSKMPVTLDPGAPMIYQKGESCLVMSTGDSIVTSVQCSERHPYVCFKKTTVIHSCGVKDEGYAYEGKTGSCYKFHNDAKTWDEAYNTCAKELGYLVIVNSAAEADVIKTLFQKYPVSQVKGYYKSSVFIGRRDWLDGRSWVTSNGKSIQDAGYTGWAPREPNNANGNENCGTMDRRGLIFDDPCILKLAFICEKVSEALDAPDNLF